MHTWSPSQMGGTIDKSRRFSTVGTELKMLQLAASAADLRRQVKAPRLAAALDACDALFEELGWGHPSASAQHGVGVGR
jgi:hypothetical protein